MKHSKMIAAIKETASPEDLENVTEFKKGNNGSGNNTIKLVFKNSEDMDKSFPGLKSKISDSIIRGEKRYGFGIIISDWMLGE